MILKEKTENNEFKNNFKKKGQVFFVNFRKTEVIIINNQ